MIERICIIFLVNFLFFFKTLGYKYTSDDLASFHNPVPFKNKWEKFFLQVRGSLKKDCQAEHFITMVIHALVCVFIYLAFNSTDASYLAALLFCFNPINNQGSVWMSGRGYVFAAMFNLMTIAIPILGPLFLWCSTYYNLGYIAPVILIGSKVWWMIFFMPFFWILRFRKFKNDIRNKTSTEMFAEDKKLHIKKFVLAIKTFGFYIAHALIPFKTAFYHSFLQSAAGSGKGKAYSIKDRFFWFGLVSIIGILGYWSTHKWDLISFGLFWWCLGVSPFLNFMRMSQEIAERYVYLGNVGLMLVLGTVLVNHPILSTAFVGMYATKMWFYMDAYQDDFYLVETSCLNSPDAWFGWHIRAMRRWEAGSLHEALAFWVMAKKISPKEFKILFNLATALIVGKNPKEAMEYMALAEQNIPAGQEEHANRLIAEWRSGKFSIIL